MQPFRYITDVASTNTFSPSMSKVLSIIPAAFSNAMEYENPEQPPPTTPMRRPAGTGFCCPMIFFTFVLMFTSGTVVVAIHISSALGYVDYNRGKQTGIRPIAMTGLMTDSGP